MRRRGLVSNLYRTVRLANDISVIASGNPHRIARRAKDKIVGRALARAGPGGCPGAGRASDVHGQHRELRVEQSD